MAIQSINNIDNYKSISFKSKKLNKLSSANSIATISANSYLNVENVMKATKEILMRCESDSNLSNYINNNIQYVKISQNVITLKGLDNNAIRISMPNGPQKSLIRLQIVKDKEPVSSITIDGYKVVDKITKNGITYKGEYEISKNELEETIQAIADNVDKPLLQLRKHIRSNYLLEEPPYIFPVKIPNITKENIVINDILSPNQGNATNLHKGAVLPRSKGYEPSEKTPLFSYAQLIKGSSTEKEKPAIIQKPRKTKKTEVKNLGINVEQLSIPKKRGRKPKRHLEDKNGEVIKKVVVKKVDKRLIDNSDAGTIPFDLFTRLGAIKKIHSEVINYKKMKNSMFFNNIESVIGEISVTKGHNLLFTTKSNDLISVRVFKSKENPDVELMRILSFNQDKTVKYGVLFEGDKIVSNYNPISFPQNTPRVSKYMTHAEIKELLNKPEFNSLINNTLYKMTQIKNVIETTSEPEPQIRIKHGRKLKEHGIIDEALKYRTFTLVYDIDSTMRKFKANFSMPLVRKIKGELGLLVDSVGKKSFDFKNAVNDNYSVALFNSKGQDIVRIINFDDDKNIKSSMFLSSDGKFAIIPKSRRFACFDMSNRCYYSSEEIKELGLVEKLNNSLDVIEPVFIKFKNDLDLRIQNKRKIKSNTTTSNGNSGIAKISTKKTKTAKSLKDKVLANAKKISPEDIQLKPLVLGDNIFANVDKSQETNSSNQDNNALVEAKNLMQKASDELDDAIKTVKKEFGTVKLFNKTVNKIKKMFNKFIDKHSS